MADLIKHLFTVYHARGEIEKLPRASIREIEEEKEIFQRPTCSPENNATLSSALDYAVDARPKKRHAPVTEPARDDV